MNEFGQCPECGTAYMSAARQCWMCPTPITSVMSETTAAPSPVAPAWTGCGNPSCDDVECCAPMIRNTDEVRPSSDVVHDLKCWPEPFRAVLSGEKVHEYRRADRDFRENDTLRLREFDPCLTCHGSLRMWANGDKDDCDCTTTANPGGRYTGREALRRITYITRCGDWDGGGGVKFVCLSLAPSAPAPSGEEEGAYDELLRDSGEHISNVANGFGAPNLAWVRRLRGALLLLKSQHASLRQRLQQAEGENKALTLDNAGLRKYLDQRASGTDPLAMAQRAEIDRLEARATRAEQDAAEATERAVRAEFRRADESHAQRARDVARLRREVDGTDLAPSFWLAAQPLATDEKERDA